MKSPLNNQTVPTSPNRQPAGRPYADAGFLGSSQYSSPGSGHNSGHNYFGGDMSSAQLFWQHSRLPFNDRNLGVLYQKV
ncbi:hypothetical protein Tco_1232362 [Tanacetum coccineum]